jgi:endonuclease/exonuclease/phosphatase family metal-dependent hydrolase
MGYTYIASFDVGYYRGIECSLMSRFEILDAKVWPDLALDDVKRDGPGWEDIPADAKRPMTFQRSPLYVRIRVKPEYELNMFVVHHKAGEGFRYAREAEALRIIDLINELCEADPSANIIVMGDFNAAPWDKSLRVYEQAGMIDTLSYRIIPTWKNAPQDEAHLYKTHESNRVLDYILMNSAAYREQVIGSPFVYGTLTPPESYDWRSDPKPDGYASDHYPVVVDLTPKDMK